jgi:hypothetical protein
LGAKTVPGPSGRWRIRSNQLLSIFTTDTLEAGSNRRDFAGASAFFVGAGFVGFIVIAGQASLAE